MRTTHVVVHPLGLNTPRRFYRGGERILAFRGLPVPDDFDGHRPEDWLASTTKLFAEGGDGLTRLPMTESALSISDGVTESALSISDGVTLGDALNHDPEFWLGPHHVARFGVATNLLTKLLDSGERLPVHSHPDRAFAARHLDCDHGKTEAWIVLEADPGAKVWLGFRDHLPTDQLAELVDAQDDRLLAALNPIEVTAGDAFLVPAGQPHAIGEGVLVLELQEPTDFSVMLEHARFGLDEQHAFLGLPRELAYESVDRGPLPREVIEATLRTRWLPDDRQNEREYAAQPAPREGDVGAEPAQRHTDTGLSFSAFAPQADPYFRAQVVRPGEGNAGTHKAAFAVTVVTQGWGALVTGDGPDRKSQQIAAGDVLLIPHGAGEVRVEGDVTAIRCMPPEGGAG